MFFLIWRLERKITINDQTKLNGVMNAGKQSGLALEGSYNALQQRLTELTKVWKATNDEAQRDAIGKEMKGLREKLSKLDESTGDFRRNVGNYANSMKDAFGAMGGAVSKVTTGPLQAFKGMLNLISKHPIVAAITILISLLVNGLGKAFKSSEQAMDKLTQAFAAFKPIGDMVMNLFQGLANVIADVVGGIASAATWLLDKIIPGYKEAADERQAIAKKDQEISKTERDNIKKNADSRKAAAEARAKAEDKDKYTIKERMKFLNEALEQEEQIAQRESELAEAKYLNMQAELALHKDITAEQEKQLNELYAAWQDAQTAYEEKQKTHNKKMSALRKQANDDAKNAAKTRLELEKSLIEQEYDLAELGSEEQINLAKEKRKKELDIQLLELKDKIKNRKEYEKAEKMAREKFNRDIKKIEQDGIQARLDNVDRTTKLALLLERRNSSEALQIQLEAEAEKLRIANETWEKLQEQNASQQELDKAQERVETILANWRGIWDSLTDALEKERSTYKEVHLFNYEPALVKAKKALDYLIEDWENFREKYSLSEDENLLRRRAIREEIAKATVEYSKLLKESKKLNKQLETEGKTLENYLSEDTIRNFFEKGEKYNPWDKVFKPEIMDNLKKNVKETREEVLHFPKDVEIEFIAKFTGDPKSLALRVQSYIDSVTKGMDDAALNTKTDEILQNLFGFDQKTLLENFERSGMAKNAENLGRIMFATFKMNLENAGAQVMEEGSVVLPQIMDLLKNAVNAGIIPEEYATNYINMLKKLVDDEKNLLQQRYENWNNLSANIADLTGGIGDIIENSIEAQVNAGDLTKEEAEKQYEWVKGMKIAEATINTISGALAAFMGYQELGQPWGGILGATAAAAVLASGYAQIQQIKNTNPYKETSLDTSAQYPTVTPYVPQYTQNITGQQETEQLANALAKQNIWVSVKDINSAQNQTKVKVAETRF